MVSEKRVERRENVNSAKAIEMLALTAERC
jgi:hypothetical protein